MTRKVGQEVHCTYTFMRRHEGAPGIAHGGAVAALVDDVCGGLHGSTAVKATQGTVDHPPLAP